MRHSDQAINIANQFQGLSLPQSHQGIVSPCSSCLNQRSISGDQGQPACPRRVAASEKTQLDNNNLDSKQYNLIVLTGNSPGDQDDGTKSLVNPIYDTASNSILIWVATFKDNSPIIASDGTVLSPDITNPAFSTSWINCQSLPFIPRDHEANYFQKGCMMSGDQVEVTIASNQQVTTSSDGSSSALPVAGTITKFSIVGQSPLQPVNKDLCVSGA